MAASTSNALPARLTGERAGERERTTDYLPARRRDHDHRAASKTWWNTVRDPQLLGIRLSPNGQASIWATLPGDGMGSILDDTELPKQVAGLLRLIGQLRIVESPNMAIAIGIQPTTMLSTGRVAQLPRQSASMLSMAVKPIRVHPDEVVSLAALGVGALEVAQILSRMLVEKATRR